MNREQIYDGVYQFFAALTLGGSPAFKTSTRNIQHWNDVPAEDCPALLFTQRSEMANYRKGLPTIWTFNAVLTLYVTTNQLVDSTVVPSSLLNPLIDLIEGSLKKDDLSNDALTLGGLVSHAAISGSIEIYEGNLGNEAVAAIPINILVPASA